MPSYDILPPQSLQPVAVGSCFWPAGESAPSGPAGVEWSYTEAFARNRGLITPAEQRLLRNKRVAIAGLGGVGGMHLVTLARTGIGRFTIADPDRFEVVNFNRQYGANTDSLGKPKAEVMAAEALRINPELDLRIITEPLGDANVGEFLADADLLIDGVDFFALQTRRALFREARRRGIWAITAAPLGFSTAWLLFSPSGMSFDEYFDINDEMDATEQLVAFAIGLSPRATHWKYFDFSWVNPATGAGPSSALACQLAAGVTAAEAIKLLLGRDGCRAAPWYYQFDPYRAKFRLGKCRWGNRHPIQRLKRAWLLRRTRSMVNGADRPSRPRTFLSALSFLPMLCEQTFCGDQIQRIPEPEAITWQPENVVQYDSVMGTKLALSYEVALGVIGRLCHKRELARAMDLGCGPGHFTLCMARGLPLREIVGIDLSPQMIALARENAVKAGLHERVSFQVADITSRLADCPQGTLDLCTFTNAAHHLPDLAAVRSVLSEMDRVVKPEGLVFVMDLVRLKNGPLMEKYVRVVGRDYREMGLEVFLEDFRNSMYAAWNPEELVAAVPKGSSRRWFHILPPGLPPLQILVGVPPGVSAWHVRLSALAAAGARKLGSRSLNIERLLLRAGVAVSRIRLVERR